MRNWTVTDQWYGVITMRIMQVCQAYISIAIAICYELHNYIGTEPRPKYGRPQLNCMIVTDSECAYSEWIKHTVYGFCVNYSAIFYFNTVCGFYELLHNSADLLKHSLGQLSVSTEQALINIQILQCSGTWFLVKLEMTSKALVNMFMETIAGAPAEHLAGRNAIVILSRSHTVQCTTYRVTF